MTLSDGILIVEKVLILFFLCSKLPLFTTSFEKTTLEIWKLGKLSKTLYGVLQVLFKKKKVGGGSASGILLDESLELL